MPSPLHPASPYHYLVSLADALSYAKLGLDRTSSPVSLGSEPSDFALLLGLKLGTADL